MIKQSEQKWSYFNIRQNDKKFKLSDDGFWKRIREKYLIGLTHFDHKLHWLFLLER